jgi:hypothetical protein
MGEREWWIRWKIDSPTVEEGTLERSTPILDQQMLPTTFEPVHRASATQDLILEEEVILIHSRSPSPAEYRASGTGSPSSQNFRSATDSLETRMPPSFSTHKSKVATEVDQDLDRRKNST